MNSPTGRTTSQPNVQSVPFNTPEAKRIRDAFIPGYMLNHEKTIREALEAGKDPHRVWAAVLFSKPEDQVTKEERQAAKSQSIYLLYNARFLATVNFPKERQNEEGDSLSNRGAGDAVDGDAGSNPR